MDTLQEKIIEIKSRAGLIQRSSVGINERGAIQIIGSDFEKRIIAGYAFVWGIPNMHREIMFKGSCAKSIQERGPNSNAKYKITFLWQHNQDDPLSLFDVLEEDDYGLYFRTKPLDAVPSADRALLQYRSGTLNGFSGGFDYIWDKIEWDDNTECLILKEVDVFEISAATIASAQESYCIRSKEDLAYLHDETEDFIKSLPRKDQLYARNLFTRHKSLISKEPFEQREKTLRNEEPPTNGINYNYLIENL